ncbi:MAG: hypothetical protein LBE31_08245 [Deltaproteobacteria bacterium]|jgi:putative RNA 2'-phosphotransferase|nr:hypothetical protein [Deltaproteobacteria bacterium]
MVKQKQTHQTDSLEKLLIYLLGVAPHEFGLLPDANGYISLKEVIAAIKGEEGFGGVSSGRITEICQRPGQLSKLEILDGRIRLKPEIPLSPKEDDSVEPQIKPKILFLALKPSVWAHAFTYGLDPKPGEPAIRLFTDKQTALKVASRFCPDPVTITVQVRAAENEGARLNYYAGQMYTAEHLNPNWLSGPPIAPREEKSPAKNKADDLPGASSSLFVESLANQNKPDNKRTKKNKYQDSPDWKTRTRRERRK